MNKKLLVLAVSSALTGTSALADTANVNVYGKLYPEFAVYDGSGATDVGATPSNIVRASDGTNPEKTQAVESSNSYVGFKGDIDIGGGMKGWFQVETSVGLDTGDGTWANRNSAAGLSGGFGNIFLGRWDTVYKQLGDPVSFLGLSSGNFVSSSNILSRSGMSSSRNSRFHERPSNYLQYETPEVGGFQFLAGYSPDEARTADKNANLASFGAKWEAGPIYVALAHEIHNDFYALTSSTARLSAVRNCTETTTAPTFPSGTPFFQRVCEPNAGLQSKDTATRLSVAYSITKDTRIGIDYAVMDYKESGNVSATGITNYKHNAYQIVASHKVGNTEFAALYAKAGEGDCTRNGGAVCTTTGLDGSMISLGVQHALNKRVAIFGLAARLENGESAAYNNTPLSIQAGTDTTAYGAGINVRF